jgi:hypothetical protein
VCPQRGRRDRWIGPIGKEAAVRLRRVYLVLGLAVGYVLGTRAGRERYEAIRDAARRVADRPDVQETAGLVAAQISHLTRRAAGAVAGRAGTSAVDAARGRLAAVTDLPGRPTTGRSARSA